MTRMEENAHRLAGALGRHADPQTVERLASLLDYDPKQLRQDMIDLYQLVLETEWAGAWE